MTTLPARSKIDDADLVRDLLVVVGESLKVIRHLAGEDLRCGASLSRHGRRIAALADRSEHLPSIIGSLTVGALGEVERVDALQAIAGWSLRSELQYADNDVLSPGDTQSTPSVLAVDEDLGPAPVGYWLQEQIPQQR